MRLNSITGKLLFLIIGAFVITTIMVLFTADKQLTRIIDESQNAVYTEKIDTILTSLYRSNERLRKTGMMEAYVEDFKESSIKAFRQSYYKYPEQRIYPFIIDEEGRIIMHPELPEGDLSLEQAEIVQKMLDGNEGSFDYIYHEQQNWCLFKKFPEWNWVIGYAVPLDIKYADALRFRYLLVYIMGGITFFVVFVLSLIVARFTKPITELTEVAATMAEGDLDHPIDVRGSDEVGLLARSFIHMRDSIQQNISELQIANKKLQIGEERYREIYNAPSEGIFIHDADTGDILDVNKGMLDMYGYTYEEALKLDIGNVSFGETPYSLEDAEQKVRDAVLHGQQTFEWLARRKDDTLFWVEVALKYVEFSSKRYVVAVTRDVSARKQAEKALSEEKERLAVTLRSIGDGVITTDISGNIILLNKVAEELTGWMSEEALGRPLNEVFQIINGLTREPCENPSKKVVSTGQIVGLSNHTTLIAKNGTELSIADSGAPILDSESKIIGVVLVFRDVTEQIKTEKELLKVKKLESIGVLAGGIAHDFNNILAAILGNINLALYDPGLKEKTKKLLVDAEKASLRAKDLTQQLLTFAKGGEPVKETSSMENVIKDSANFVLHGDKVACKYNIPENLWFADIDRGQISQVVQNIVLNASHAMPDGGIIQITCDNIDSPQALEDSLPRNKRFIRVSIADSGIGIPQNVIDKIFDPYFSTKQEGSGLGLAVCHSIITKHDGHISVQSTPGVGTTFIIYLPASEYQTEEKKRAETTEIDKGKAKIMVMDDDEMVRDVAKAMLSKMGHEVLLVQDGAEAVAVYREHSDSGEPIDIVIMDLTIPGGMGGQEAVKKILAFDPDAKVIVSSGYSNDPIMANCQEYGFYFAIVKPYQLSELSEIINKVMT